MSDSLVDLGDSSPREGSPPPKPKDPFDLDSLDTKVTEYPRDIYSSFCFQPKMLTSVFGPIPGLEGVCSLLCGKRKQKFQSFCCMLENAADCFLVCGSSFDIAAVISQKINSKLAFGLRCDIVSVTIAIEGCNNVSMANDTELPL